VRALNATRRDQRHTKESPWHTVSHACDHTQRLTTTGPRHYPKLEDVIARAKPERRINMGHTRPIRQPRRLPLAKQADVGEMQEDMQRREVTEESDSP
jgi:hypothetical protein